MQREIESYKKGKISVQTFAKKLLSSGILSSLQDCGQSVDSINSVVLALITGGLLPEKKKAELSRCTSHLDLYRWLQKNGFLSQLRDLIEAYKAGKLVVMVGDKPTSTEHTFVSKLYQSGILSKIKGHESLEESKKDVDSIGTLVWAIAVGEDIPKSKLGYLAWEASAFDLYRDMEKNGFTEELRPLTEAYNSGKVSKYALIRQLHRRSILSKVQGSGRDVLSLETLINALISGGLLPYDSKTDLKWASGAFDLFRDITEEKNISSYIQDFCDVLNTRIEDKEISPALYALHISLLHDSVNQTIKRKERTIHASTFSSALISGGVIPESLEHTIKCATGALQRAEALALRELYKSSSSFSDFYRKMVEDWHLLRENLKSTYTRGAPPEKPFSKSYANNIWQALSAMEGILE